MKTADKPRVLVVHNRDFEHSQQDPENGSRADIRGTTEDVVAALTRTGLTADALGIDGEVAGAMTAIAAFAPDVVFNLCESLSGDARFEPLLPLLLEHAGISYTGSPPLTLGVALHKQKAKAALRDAGVPTPDAVCLSTPDIAAVALPFPLIVKPSREDASIGISAQSVVHDRAELGRQVAAVIARYRQPALVERFIEGREIYVSMLGREDGDIDLLPLHEIDFSEMPAGQPRIVSYAAKWEETSAEYRGTKPVVCAGLPEAVVARIGSVARAAFAAMELRDYGRLDVRLAGDGTPYVIDINPNCDLSEASGGFARAGRAAGLGYDEVIRRIVDLALQRRTHADTIPIAVRSRTAHRHPLAGSGIPLRRDRVRDRAARRGAGPG
ncbi:MAG TPA: ATP-grasp domain-containing protein [Polyangia bacterium]